MKGFHISESTDPRSRSRSASRPPSALDLVRHSVELGTRAMLGGRVTDGLWRVWMPLDVDRVVELPWTGRRVVEARPHRVLDLSSPKLLACWLAANTNSEVLATDKWASEVESWQRLTAAADPNGVRYSRLRLAVADGTQLPYDEASFDFVYSTSVIEHIDDDGDIRAMGEFERVLEPGGFLALTFPYRSKLELEFVDHDLYEKKFIGEPLFFQRHYSSESVEERLLANRSFAVVERGVWRKRGIERARSGLRSVVPPRWEIGRFLGPALLVLGSRAMEETSLGEIGTDNVMHLLLQKT